MLQQNWLYLYIHLYICYAEKDHIHNWMLVFHLIFFSLNIFQVFFPCQHIVSHFLEVAFKALKGDSIAHQNAYNSIRSHQHASYTLASITYYQIDYFCLSDSYISFSFLSLRLSSCMSVSVFVRIMCLYVVRKLWVQARVSVSIHAFTLWGCIP